MSGTPTTAGPGRIDDGFETTLELTAAAICEATVQGRFVRVSQKLCEMLGYTQEVLLRRTLLEIVGDLEDRETLLVEQRRLLRGTLRSYSREVRVKRRHGSELWATLTVNRLTAKGARLPTLGVVCQSVDDRRCGEGRLWESAGFARAVIDGLKTHVCVLDERGSIVAVNRAWRGFAQDSGALDSATVGSNYLATCDAAGERGFTDGRALAAGIRSVMTGELELVERELVYRALDERQWFLVRASRFSSEGSFRILLTRQLSTARKLAELEVRSARENLNLAVRAANVGLWDWDLETNEVHYSLAWKEQLGYSETEIANSLDEWKRLVHPDHVVPTLALVERCIKDPALDFQTEFPIRHKDGDYRWMLSKASVIRSEEGRPIRLIGGHVDITAHKRSDEALRERDAIFQQLADNLADVFWVGSADGSRLHYVSPAYERIWGRSSGDLYAAPDSWWRAIHVDDRARMEDVRRSSPVEEGYDEEFRIVRGDGGVRWIHARTFPVAGASGGTTRVVGIARDVTEKKLAEQKLVQLAHFDALTGLPNRALFYERLQQALAQSNGHHWTVAMMLLDLDRFKLVNDTLAHAYGDKLLLQVGRRLQHNVRHLDLVGRLGGDEFGVILPALASPEEAESVAQKIMKSFAEPFDLDGQEVFVSASLGITFYTSADEGVDTMIMNADVAMYNAKQDGRNTYRRYSKVMSDGALARLQLETRLRRALENEEFVVHYQPKVGIESGGVTGLEALIRWQLRGEGLVQPDEFIPLMEQTGLIVPVGEWLLGEVCERLSAWRDAGLQVVPVAINVAARQLQQPGFAAGVAKTLEQHGTDPRLIEIEITESSLMESPETAIAVLNELSALGIRVAADDFGTGYSSLSYLKRFPLDALKIDRSFVRDAATDPDSAAIIRAVTALAHSVGLKVVAEGVETQGHFAFLRDIGCDQAQGYLFWRPLDAQACAAVLGAGSRIPATLMLDVDVDAEAPAVLIVDEEQRYAAFLAEYLRDEPCRTLVAASAGEALKLLASHGVRAVISDQRPPGMAGIELLRRAKRMHPDALRVMLSSTADCSMAAGAIDSGDVHGLFVKGKDEERLRAELREVLTDQRRADAK
jgi:diguanylate cyclase (GGDEF)-like protein/PAS domain S-box-containing protein